MERKLKWSEGGRRDEWVVKRREIVCVVHVERDCFLPFFNVSGVEVELRVLKEVVFLMLSDAGGV